MVTLESTLALPGGTAIPRLGLGVFQAPPGTPTQLAVRSALLAGYRHIDTAATYGNEADVGLALRESGVPREQVFVTTKLWNSDHGYDRAIAAFGASLARLGLSYVDLYLIHWPVAKLRGESWRALETLHGEGRCRAIGVSNYMQHHLQELLGQAKIPPAANQIEQHPFLYQADLIAFCRKQGIVVEAYSPLVRGQRFSHPTLVRAAEQHGKSPAQILIRWALQHDLVALPKSVHAERIRENAAVFDFALSGDEMAALDGLHENLHTAWDPTEAP